jgi:hypothetical protein
MFCYQNVPTTSSHYCLSVSTTKQTVSSSSNNVVVVVVVVVVNAVLLFENLNETRWRQVVVGRGETFL